MQSGSVLGKKGWSPEEAPVMCHPDKSWARKLSTGHRSFPPLFLYLVSNFQGFSFKTTLSLFFGHLISAPLVAAVNYVLRAYLCPITPFPQQITNITMEEAALGVASSGGHQNAMRR